MDRILRVLVVDDSAYVRKVIKQMLSRSPFIEVVGTARAGEEHRQVQVLVKINVPGHYRDRNLDGRAAGVKTIGAAFSAGFPVACCDCAPYAGRLYRTVREALERTVGAGSVRSAGRR